MDGRGKGPRKLLLYCKDCGKKGEKVGSSSGAKQYLKIVMSCLIAGTDWTSYSWISSCGFGLRSMAKSTFIKSRRKILQKLTVYVRNLLKCHSDELLELLKEEGAQPDSDDKYWIAVSFDGSWLTRGFTSNHGVVLAISPVTDKVIDFEVLSKNCTICLNSPSFTDHECNSNYQGTSSNMETTGVKRIYERSRMSCFKYAHYVGDGDSSAFAAIKNAYDGNPVVKKDDCVNHVEKRVRYHAKNLKQELQRLGRGIGGRGKLTDNMIGKIQSSYGLAIRQNSLSGFSVLTEEEIRKGVEIMSRACRASFLHRCQNHSLCKQGAASWCFFQRAVAMNVEPVPKKESSYLPAEFAEILAPIIDRLCSEDLMLRCIMGYDQNRNESLNSLIWGVCNKAKYHGIEAVQVAVHLGIIRYCNGVFDFNSLHGLLGLDISDFDIEQSDRIDRKRVAKSGRTAEARRAKIAKRKRDNAMLEEEARNPTYAAGSAA